MYIKSNFVKLIYITGSTFKKTLSDPNSYLLTSFVCPSLVFSWENMALNTSDLALSMNL